MWLITNEAQLLVCWTSRLFMLIWCSGSSPVCSTTPLVIWFVVVVVFTRHATDAVRLSDENKHESCSSDSFAGREDRLVRRRIDKKRRLFIHCAIRSNRFNSSDKAREQKQNHRPPPPSSSSCLLFRQKSTHQICSWKEISDVLQFRFAAADTAVMWRSGELWLSAHRGVQRVESNGLLMTSPSWGVYSCYNMSKNRKTCLINICNYK